MYITIKFLPEFFYLLSFLIYAKFYVCGHEICLSFLLYLSFFLFLFCLWL